MYRPGDSEPDGRRVVGGEGEEKTEESRPSRYLRVSPFRLIIKSLSSRPGVHTIKICHGKFEYCECSLFCSRFFFCLREK